MRIHTAVRSVVVALLLVASSIKTHAVVANPQSLGWLENANPTNVLTASGGTITNYTIVQSPLHGQILVAAGFTNNGKWNYVPQVTNFFGEDAFTFCAVAGGVTSAPARVAITVTNVNTAPFAHQQFLKTRPGQVLAVTLTADDDYDFMSFGTNSSVTTHFSPNAAFLNLHYVLASSPTNGTLTTTNDGGYILPDLIYTPTPGISNVFDSFTFRATDGSLTSAVATVMIRIGNYNAGTNYFSPNFQTNLTHYFDVPLTNKGTIRPGYESTALSPTNGTVGGTFFGVGRTDDGFVQLNLGLSQFLDRMARSNMFSLYGHSFSNLWINNNGLVSFQTGIAAYSATYFPANVGGLLAPYWEDVDTSSTAKGGVVTLGRGYVNGRQSTLVTWNDVGSYSNAGQSTAGLNRFQIVMIDRSDVGDGMFDFEYNYEYAETLYGSASGGVYPGIGFDAGDGTNYFNYIYSHTASVAGIATNSNCGIFGRLFYRSYPTPSCAVTNPAWLGPTSALLIGDIPTYDLTTLPTFSVYSVTNGTTNFFTNVTAALPLAYSTNLLRVTATVSNLWPDGQYLVKLTNNGTGIVSGDVLFSRPKLANMVVNYGTLVPSYNPIITNYNVGVLFSSGFTVTPYPQTATDLVQVQWNTNAPETVASGAPSSPYFASQHYPATNHMAVSILSTNGNPVRTYAINVAVLPSTESRLSDLFLSAGTITPTFSLSQTNYSLTIPSSVGGTAVTATPISSQATNTYRINGGAYSTNNFFGLNVGTNTIDVRCTAENGTSNTVYTVTVIRTANTDSTLAGINLSAGTLSPSFNPGTNQYSATVGLLVTNITIGAFTTYSNASVKINGGSYALQTNSATVSLAFGNNIIPITVLSESGVASTYTLTVLRTLPVANTLVPSVVTTNVILKGTFDAINLPTKVYFQYGLTTSYGSFTPTNQMMATSSALTFNGANQYIRTTNRISNDFTIEFWFKSAQTAGFVGSGWNYGMGIVDGQVTGGTNGFGVSFGAGRIMYGVGYAGTTLTSGSLADNTWHHVAATRFGSLMELYIDGVSIANTNSGNTGAFNQVTNLMIGALAFTNNFFQGSIDEIRIWNIARTNFQIMQNFDKSMSGNEPGLVNYFHFDEGTGSTTTDISSLGGTGILSNNPVWTTVAAITNYSAMAPNVSRANTYHCRIMTESAAGVYQGGDISFQVLPEAPFVLTTSATATNSVTATLNVSVNPAGAPTGVRFYWGTNDAIGRFTDLSSWISVGGGDAPLSTNLTITGLIPARTYHFWAEATNFMNSASPTKGTNTLFTTLTPVINSMSPSNGPTIGSTLITMDGSYLGGNDQVFIGGSPCTITSQTNTQVKFLTPSGTGTNLAVTLNVEGKYNLTSPTPFNYDRPVLFSVTPNHGPTVGGSAITLAGTNFGFQTVTASVTIGGQSATVSSCNHTQIVCQLPAGQGASKAVVVTVGGQTNLVAGTFSYDGPSITNVSPNIGPAAGGIEITLTGANFGTSGTLSFNGQPISTTFYSQNQIKFMLPAGQGLSNAISVNVSGQVSPNAYFSYNAPGISSVTPNHGPAAGGVEITLGGTNFGASGTLTFNGQAVTPTSYTNTQIKFTLPAGQGTNRSIVVSVGGQNSSPIFFDYDRPSISLVSPNHGPTFGNGETVTLTGTNFGSAGFGTVTFNGQGVVVLSYINSQIQFLQPSGQGTNNSIVVVAGGQSSLPATFSFDGPTITNVSPSFGPAAGGIEVVLTGTNFGTSGTLTFNGQAVSPTIYFDNQIRFTLPSGQGLSNAIVLNVSGQVSAPVYFNYIAPSITLLSPNHGPTIGGTEITLTGTNFGTSGTVTFDGQNQPTTSYNNSQIKFTLPSGQGTNKSIVVRVSGQNSSATTFSYDGPAITNMTPNIGPTAGGIEITLAGSNFGTNGALTFNGQAVTPTVYSHSQIKFVLPAGQALSNAIVLNVGGQASSPVYFNYSAPSITLVSPNHGPTIGGTEITLTGTNFGTSGTVTFDGQVVPTIDYNNTEVKFTLPSGQGAGKSISVAVSGQNSSLATFNYDGPAITNVSPNIGPVAGGIEITLSGSNFGTNGTVTFNGQAVTTTGYTNSQIKFILPAGQGTGNAILVDVSGQVSAPALFSYTAPSITQVSPNHGPTIGGIEITLTGTNFGTNGTLGFDGQMQTTTSYNNTQIKFMLPSGQGLGKSVVVTAGGQNSSAATFNYDGPTITNVSPSMGPVEGGIPITLTGSNFGTNGMVSIGGQSCPISFYSHSLIICILPAGQGLNKAVTVQSGTQTSNTKSFGYYGAPTATTLSADGAASIVYGSVNPNGATTIVYFQYGSDSSYGFLSDTNILPVADEALSVTNVLADLESGAVYHYRVVAENLAGTNYGADLVFTNVPSADLAVSLSASPEPVGLGTNLTYSITVTNRGPNPSLAVALTNTLPANVNFVSASEGGVLDSGKVVYQFASLEVGESTNVTVVVAASTWLGDITNCVSVSGGISDTNLANNTAFVVSSGMPLIDSDPTARTNNAGTTAVFSVAVHGQYLSFQWFKNGNPLVNSGKILGAGSDTLSILNVLAADAGNYSVIVSNVAGTATSASAALTVIDPFISGQPANQTLTNLGTINLSVTAFGTSPLKYQWLKNGTAIAKATNSFFLKTNAVVGDAGVYSVRVTNALNSVVTSAGAVVSVDLPIAITKQPVGLARIYGQVAVAKFSVTASGNNQKYLWRKNGTAIAGATTSIYVVPVITNAPGSFDIYSVIVSNGLYSATSSDAALASLADTNIPTVSITTPKAAIYDDATVTGYKMGIGGGAADNAQVTNVLFSINASAFGALSLNTNGPSVKWTNAAITVKPGTNILQVYSVDYSGLTSKVSTVKFIYAVRSAFTLITNNLPAGDIVNFVKPTFDKTFGTNDGSAPLLVGCGYKLTALNVFTNGYIFTNWTFTSSTNATQLVLETNNLTLNYVMRSNMTVYANFITNPFAIYKGTYNGLFHEADEVRHHSAGYVSLMTTEKLGYSGKLLLDGDTVAFSGKFNLDGTATNTLSRAALGKSSLRLTLVMDFAGASQTVTGSVSDISAGWTADILTDRYLWNKSSKPATLYATNYTMAVPGFDDNTNGPAGYGYALVIVDADGNVKTAGATADGQTISQATMLSQDGRWPLHMPIYADTNDIVAGKPIKRTRGELMGWMKFEANTNAFAANTNFAPVGKIDWIKTGWTNNSWAHGFTNQINVLSSVQKAPAIGEVLYLPFTNFVAVLSEGGLSSSISNVVILKTNNTFFVDTRRTNAEPIYANKFSAQLTAKTGFINGTFTNETSQGKNITWKGVLLQDYTNGYGFFFDNVTTNASGKVRLSPMTNSFGE